MKSLVEYIKESKTEQYKIPVKELYRIAVEQGIKDHESWDKNWEWENHAQKKPSPNELSVDGCMVIRCEILGVPYKNVSKKEYSQKVLNVFKKYWDNEILVERSYHTSYGERFYEFDCNFDDDIVIKIEYMGSLKDMNKYKLK